MMLSAHDINSYSFISIPQTLNCLKRSCSLVIRARIATFVNPIWPLGGGGGGGYNDPTTDSCYISVSQQSLVVKNCLTSRVNASDIFCSNLKFLASLNLKS